MILNINQLRAFYTAARLGSVSKAAENLMVTPPAITMQIKQLEKTIGIRLLFRKGNTIRLTHLGLDVQKKAEGIFDRINEMEDFFEDITIGRSGELRIGCPQTPAKHLMPRLIEAFKKTYPGVKIILDQGANSDMLQSIMERRNELAIIRHSVEDKRLKIRLIGIEKIVLVAAPGSTLTYSEQVSVAQLAQVPFIAYKQGSGVREVLSEYFRRLKVIPPTLAMESASADFIKELVRRDVGMAFIERHAVKEELAAGFLKEVHVLEGAPKIKFGIGYLNRKDLSPAAWAFLRLIDRSSDLLPFTG